MFEIASDTKSATESVIDQYPSSAIGPLLCDPDVPYEIEEHGSFWFFNNNPGAGEHYLRCVVWRDEYTEEIIGHNFDYVRSDGNNWRTVVSADTVEEAAEFVWYGWRDQARDAAREFLANKYHRLILGTLELDEINDFDRWWE